MPIVDILLFAALAIFFAVRLLRVLGQHSEHTSARDPIDQAFFEAPEEHAQVSEVSNLIKPAQIIINPQLRSQEALIHSHDPDFSLDEFMKNAAQAFCLILKAFSAHDRETLQNLVDAPIFKIFNQAMTSREQAGHTLENDVVGIKIVEALDLSLKDLTAQIQVRFVSEQIHTVRDAHGDVIEGVANMVDEIKDVWWFERNFDNQSPIWKLVRT